MEFEKFVEVCHQCVLKMNKEWSDAGSSYELELHENYTRVNRSNSYALTLTNKNIASSVCPSVNLHNIYDFYCNNQENTVEDVLMRSIKTLEKALENPATGQLRSENIIDYLKDASYLREMSFVTLINRNLNKKLLENALWEPYAEDLALVLRLRVKIGEEEGSFIISKSAKQLLALDVAELFVCAKENVIRETSCVSMGETLGQCGLFLPFDGGMSVLRCEHGGAAALIAVDVLESISVKLGSDLVILPSSINDCIVLPFEYEVDASFFKMMIEEVNNEEVPADEVLSDHPYLYQQGSYEVIPWVDDILFEKKKA